MRNSKQRNRIYEIVKNTDRHPTADWIYEEARKLMPSISLGTVYRNLGQLVDNNMIRSLTYQGSVRYDGMIENHHHFACKTCGMIYDVFFETESFLNKISSRSEHHITDLDVKLSGTCKNCKN